MSHKYYEKMSLRLRIQHIVLLVAFTVLMITGGIVLFSESWFSQVFVNNELLFTIRGILHRIFAVIFIGLCIHHAIFILFTKEGREFFYDMLPTWQDPVNFFESIKYNLGLSNRHPHYGRFNYLEKFEYAAVVWGSVVMIITGFILWFEGLALIIFPKWIIDVSLIIHSFESILAFLTIIIWHMYNVHFNPDVFPMSRVWLDGKMSEEELKKKHPAYYDKISNGNKNA